MEKILLNDILPILVIMVLGYVLGRVSYFDDDQRQGLNKVVLNIALPAALFVSIVKATRADLVADITLTVISVVGVVAMFMLSFFLCRLFFKHNIQEAAVCALIAGSPTIGFLGFAVLDPIWGTNVETGLVVAIVAIVVNAITIPIGFYLINVGQSKTKALAAAGTSSTPAPTHETETKDKKAELSAASPVKSIKKDKSDKKKMNPNLKAVLDALKEPVVWSPLLAVVLVIIGVRFPSELDPCFELIAKANSGVAVLAAGLALSTVKFSLGPEILWNTFFRLILTPAVILVAGLLCGMGGTQLQMLVMAVALPPAFSGIIISSRYNIYVREGASSVAVSTAGFAATSILWIWLTPLVEGMFH